MNKCNAEFPDLEPCKFKVKWVIRAASFRMYSCGSHLNNVCARMLETGVEYMTLSRSNDGEG